MALKAVLEKDAYDALDTVLQAEYTEKDGKFTLTPPEGFVPEANVTRLTTALSKERDDHKKSKDKLQAFHGLEPEEVRVKLDRIPELELAAAGKLDDKAIDNIVNTRISAKLAPVERERDQLKVKVVEKDGIIDTFRTQEKTRSVHDTIRAAATKAKLAPEALDDALLLAERVFEVQDDGNVVTKDRVGYTPGLSADQWLTDLQPKKPHWWGPSGGGGARNGNGGGNAGANPWTAESWNITEQGAALRADPKRADRLAKAAGHESAVGARKPAPKA